MQTSTTAATARPSPTTQTYTICWADYFGRLFQYSTEAYCASGAIDRLYNDVGNLVCGVQWVEDQQGARV